MRSQDVAPPTPSNPPKPQSVQNEQHENEADLSSAAQTPVGRRLEWTCRGDEPARLEDPAAVGTASNAFATAPTRACTVGIKRDAPTIALGHAAVRRRHIIYFERADQLFKRLKAASRLDNSDDAEMRKLLRVDLLILDDF
ncbi:MAG: ATP-binding protein [Acidimicrobiales bacterium]